MGMVQFKGDVLQINNTLEMPAGSSVDFGAQCLTSDLGSGTEEHYNLEITAVTTATVIYDGNSVQLEQGRISRKNEPCPTTTSSTTAATTSPLATPTVAAPVSKITGRVTISSTVVAELSPTTDRVVLDDNLCFTEPVEMVVEGNDVWMDIDDGGQAEDAAGNVIQVNLAPGDGIKRQQLVPEGTYTLTCYDTSNPPLRALAFTSFNSFGDEN
jgi:hypothetical protein